MDTSVNIHIIILKFPLRVPKVHLEGSLSQNVDVGPSSYFMKKRVTFYHFLQYKFFHFIK